MNKVVWVKLWLENYSLLRYSEPEDPRIGKNTGVNMAGASLVFKLF